MTLSQLIRISLVLFLLFPFLFLLYQFPLSFRGVVDTAELSWAFKNSFIQAFFSAALSLVFGLWGALGLIGLRSLKWRKAFELLCLLPNFLPPLFTLLAILSAAPFFPMGIAGIVVIHTFMNFGLVAVLFAHILESKVGPVTEVAYIEGARRWRLWAQVLLPILKKDILLLGLFVFVICFGSFSVPLIVGGGQGTTVEVLIYEKIRLSADWSEATLLALLQSVFIFIVSLMVSRRRTHVPVREVFLKMISARSGLVLVSFLMAVYFYGYGQGLFSGLSMWSRFTGMGMDIFMAFLGSLAIGISTGVLCLLGLSLIAYCWPQAWFEKFLAGYVAPSTSLACFSLLIITPNEGFYPFIKIPLTLALLFLNGLFRMGWDSLLHSLENQIQIAYAMGASRGQIFKAVLLPQVLERAGTLAGIAAVWACGDFAVSRILAHKELTLAMMTDTLMSSYRLGQASVISILVMGVGALCYFIFTGGSRVLRGKLN